MNLTGRHFINYYLLFIYLLNHLIFPFVVITFPFSICVKAIGDEEGSIYCDKCNLWVHIKCNNLNYIDYKYLSGNCDHWFCLKCNSQLFPFGTLGNKKFMQHILHSSNMKNENEIEYNILV